MRAYLFPGQGSQAIGMGGKLFDEFPLLTEQASEILGYSIRDLCLHNPDERLSQTQYTQPALFVVNALSYEQKCRDGQGPPACAAGHSLGEFNALHAAGMLDFATALRLVKRRGEFMAQARGGGMAAIIGLSREQVDAALQSSPFNQLQIANLNSPFQIVVSGLHADVLAAQPFFEQAGARMYLPLNVSGAFHSRYMSDAATQFAALLDSVRFAPFQFPVIANVTARPYTVEQARELLSAQLTEPVQWTDSMRYLIARGVTDFEEVGPGNVLTGLVARIRREAGPLPLPDEPSVAPVEMVAPPITVIAPPRTKATEDKPDGSRLGSAEFRRDYGVKYAYVAGAMWHGVASADMVIRMGRARLLSFFGAGGLELDEVESAIVRIREALGADLPYGMNLLSHYHAPELEERTVDLYLRHNIRNIEAASYVTLTPAIIRYRLKGLRREADGRVRCAHRILAKISRPEVAEAFLSPAPERLVRSLLAAGQISPEEAAMSRSVPMADDLCVEADSGGHTDRGVALVLVPRMLRLRDEFMQRFNYAARIRVGAAGGIGTPEAVAVAFVMGADFVLTGSINQCTVEAGTSDAVKDLLERADVQDMDYAPAGDMFEVGSKVQVLKRGLLFPARASKLYELYRRYDSLDELDAVTRNQLESRYFKRNIAEVYEEVKTYFARRAPEEIERAERDPKHKMALTFRWYFHRSSQLARNGAEEGKVDYQIHTGPALGAFNSWVKGTALESWRNRHADEIGERLMEGAAALLAERLQALAGDRMRSR